MSKSLHAALSNGAEDEGISLNTYIVTLLSERHIEKKLMNKIEAIQSLLKATNSKR
jgi:predicted HicB family RNase H-like nuclease